VSSTVSFADVAVACGYARAYRSETLEGFERAYAEAMKGGKPALIHARITPGSLDKLGRPTVKPHEVAARFKAFLAAG